MFTKFIALLVTLPDPVLGAMTSVILVLIGAVGKYLYLNIIYVILCLCAMALMVTVSYDTINVMLFIFKRGLDSALVLLPTDILRLFGRMTAFWHIIVSMSRAWCV